MLSFPSMIYRFVCECESTQIFWWKDWIAVPYMIKWRSIFVSGSVIISYVWSKPKSHQQHTRKSTKPIVNYACPGRLGAIIT